MIDSHCHLADEAFAAGSGGGRRACAGSRRAARDVHPGGGRRRRSPVRAVEVRRLWPEIRCGRRRAPAPRGRDSRARGRRGGGRQRRDRRRRRERDRRDRSRLSLRFLAAGRPAGRLQRPGVARPQAGSARSSSTRGRPTDDTFASCRVAGQSVVRGIFHCFTGDVAMARNALDLGFYISICRDRDVSRTPPTSGRSRHSCRPIGC